MEQIKMEQIKMEQIKMEQTDRTSIIDLCPKKFNKKLLIFFFSESSLTDNLKFFFKTKISNVRTIMFLFNFYIFKYKLLDEKDFKRKTIKLDRKMLYFFPDAKYGDKITRYDLKQMVYKCIDNDLDETEKNLLNSVETSEQVEYEEKHILLISEFLKDFLDYHGLPKPKKIYYSEPE